MSKKSSKKIYIRVDKPIEVGDLVRCVKDDWPCDAGDIMKVRRLSSMEDGIFFIHGSHIYLDKTRWEPVHKLKVGDRVVSSLFVYTVFTVENIADRSGGWNVRVSCGAWGAVVAADTLTLYQPEKHDPKPTPLTSDGMVISGPNIYATTLHEALGIPSPSKCEANGVDFYTTVRRHFVKREIAEMIVELLDRDDKENCPQSSVVISNWRDLDKTVTALDNDDKHHTATISPSDTWDTLTGVYVALSKATGRKLPDWIYGGER